MGEKISLLKADAPTTPTTMRRAFGAPVDINTSIGGGLDASMLSCDNIDTTARLDSRKSLSSSQFGRNSFIKPGAPPSAKKSLAVPGRPSLMPGGDRCVLGTHFKGPRGAQWLSQGLGVGTNRYWGRQTPCPCLPVPYAHTPHALTRLFAPFIF